MCVLKDAHMKKLVLFLAAVSLVTVTQAQCPNYSFQFGYTNYITKGQTNLNGFRVAYWPQQYRYPRYVRNNSLAAMSYQCVDNSGSVGMFVDGVFTPTDSVKVDQYQALVGGLIMPIFDPGINVYLGFGSKWNSATGEEYNSEFIATYGLSFILPNRGLTLSVGRQNRAREMFAKNGANTTIGIGYTFRRQ